MGRVRTKVRKGVVEVWCRYIIRNGKRIYPKTAKCFHFFIPLK